MKETIDIIWSEYFAEKCASIDTMEEQALIKKLGKIHQTAKEKLSQEQNDVIEKYIDAIYEVQDYFIKKAFFKGCAFATSLISELKNFNK